jgi:hypothetical protein
VGGANASNTEWTEVLMREATKHMDAISIAMPTACA